MCWSTRRVFFTAVQIAYCDDACRQSRRNKKEKNLIFFQQCHQIKVEKRKETNSFIQVLIELLLDCESPRYAIVWPPDTPNPFRYALFYSPLLDCLSFLRLRCCTIPVMSYLKTGRRHIPYRNQKECAQHSKRSFSKVNGDDSGELRSTQRASGL